MQLWRRRGGPALMFLVLLLTAVPVADASARAGSSGTALTAAAAKRTPTGGTKAPGKAGAKAQPKAAAKPGWLVERVRFEPLDAGGGFAVAGVGAYRGAIEVGRAPNGGVGVVNDVELEEYVKGLAEVPSSWPAEALKAQAIAARTYALHELTLDPGIGTAARAVGAQICATEACQVYAGVAKEQNPANAESFPNWAAAVAQTKGEVVLFENGPILAKYSSSNGGRSVAGGRPYLRVVDDPDDRHSPLHRWRAQVANTDVAAALGLPGTIVRLSRSGDLVLVDWQGGDGGVDRLTMAASDFRSRVNAAVPPPQGLPRVMPFVRFTPSAEPSTNTVVIEGGGYGHGIGMSQWGAYGKALRGMKAPDILAAYYGGLRPTRVDESKLPKTIKVAVDLGRSDAAVTSGGRFRVLDQAGRPISVVAQGPWRVVPEGGAVRVIPPAGQDGVPGVEPLAVDPAAPAAPVNVRFRLSAPAVVRLTLTDASGAPAGTREVGLLDAGELSHAIEAPATPGRYVVTILADAGGGRLASVPVTVDVQAEAVPTIGPATAQGAADLRAAGAASRDGAPTPGGRDIAAAIAFALLLAVARGTYRAHRTASASR